MAEGRYFFALWPEDEVGERLAAEARRIDTRGRLHHLEDLHMTLVFLGPLATDQIPCVEAVAEGIIGRCFTLEVNGIGYWHRPRILWAGPRQMPEALSQLVFDLQSGLKGCGFEPERRRYKPHVTLYRKAERGDAQIIEPAIAWPVSEFVLAVSAGGGPDDPRYRILHRWPLDAERVPALSGQQRPLD